MNLAEAEPRATRKPMVMGSTSTNIAALEAIRRLDGPAKGMMFRAKENPRMPRISKRPVSLEFPRSVCKWLELIKQVS